MTAPPSRSRVPTREVPEPSDLLDVAIERDAWREVSQHLEIAASMSSRSRSCPARYPSGGSCPYRWDLTADSRLDLVGHAGDDAAGSWSAGLAFPRRERAILREWVPGGRSRRSRSGGDVARADGGARRSRRAERRGSPGRRAGPVRRGRVRRAARGVDGSPDAAGRSRSPSRSRTTGACTSSRALREAVEADGPRCSRGWAARHRRLGHRRRGRPEGGHGAHRAGGAPTPRC